MGRQIGWILVWAGIFLACRGAAAQVSRPPFGPGKVPGFPEGFPTFGPGGRGEAFDPQKMFDQLFGQGGGADFDDEQLAKVEISSQEEARLGKQSLDDVRRSLAQRKLKLVESGSEVEYLSRLVALLQPLMTQSERYRKLKVYLLESSEPEAYAYPGGHLLFSRGLLNAAGCEAAVVTVAGHELAHLDRGHLLRRAKQWKLAQQSFADPAKGFHPDKMFQTMGLMQKLFQRPFGPEEELEADRDGITWAYHLGYDPRSVEAVYAALEKKGGAAGELPAFLRTHPQSAERRANLRATLSALVETGPARDMYLGRLNLARRVTRKEREFPE